MMCVLHGSNGSNDKQIDLRTDAQQTAYLIVA